jgi:hypothetical protein
MVGSSVTSQRTTKRRFESLSCCCWRWRSFSCPLDDGDGEEEEEDADEEKKDDGDDGEENTSLRIAALVAAGSLCRVVARIGMDERDVRRRRWQVRAWPMPLLEGQMKIQGVEGIAAVQIDYDGSLLGPVVHF